MKFNFDVRWIFLKIYVLNVPIFDAKIIFGISHQFLRCILRIRKEQYSYFLVSKIAYFVPNNDSSRTFALVSFKVKEFAESQRMRIRDGGDIGKPSQNCVLSDYMMILV